MAAERQASPEQQSMETSSGANDGHDQEKEDKEKRREAKVCRHVLLVSPWPFSVRLFRSCEHSISGTPWQKLINGSYYDGHRSSPP